MSERWFYAALLSESSDLRASSSEIENSAAETPDLCEAVEQFDPTFGPSPGAVVDAFRASVSLACSHARESRFVPALRVALTAFEELTSSSENRDWTELACRCVRLWNVLACCDAAAFKLVGPAAQAALVPAMAVAVGSLSTSASETKERRSYDELLLSCVVKTFGVAPSPVCPVKQLGSLATSCITAFMANCEGDVYASSSQKLLRLASSALARFVGSCLGSANPGSAFEVSLSEMLLALLECQNKAVPKVLRKQCQEAVRVLVLVPVAVATCHKAPSAKEPSADKLLAQLKRTVLKISEVKLLRIGRGLRKLTRDLSRTLDSEMATRGSKNGGRSQQGSMAEPSKMRESKSAFAMKLSEIFKVAVQKATGKGEMGNAAAYLAVLAEVLKAVDDAGFLGMVTMEEEEKFFASVSELAELSWQQCPEAFDSAQRVLCATMRVSPTSVESRLEQSLRSLWTTRWSEDKHPPCDDLLFEITATFSRIRQPEKIFELMLGVLAKLDTPQLGPFFCRPAFFVSLAEATFQLSAGQLYSVWEQIGTLWKDKFSLPEADGGMRFRFCALWTAVVSGTPSSHCSAGKMSQCISSTLELLSRFVGTSKVIDDLLPVISALLALCSRLQTPPDHLSELQDVVSKLLATPPPSNSPYSLKAEWLHFAVTNSVASSTIATFVSSLLSAGRLVSSRSQWTVATVFPPPASSTLGVWQTAVSHVAQLAAICSEADMNRCLKEIVALLLSKEKGAETITTALLTNSRIQEDPTILRLLPVVLTDVLCEVGSLAFSHWPYASSRDMPSGISPNKQTLNSFRLLEARPTADLAFLATRTGRLLSFARALRTYISEGDTTSRLVTIVEALDVSLGRSFPFLRTACRVLVSELSVPFPGLMDVVLENPEPLASNFSGTLAMLGTLFRNALAASVSQSTEQPSLQLEEFVRKISRVPELLPDVVESLVPQHGAIASPFPQWLQVLVSAVMDTLRGFVAREEWVAACWKLARSSLLLWDHLSRSHQDANSLLLRLVSQIDAVLTNPERNREDRVECLRFLRQFIRIHHARAATSPVLTPRLLALLHLLGGRCSASPELLELLCESYVEFVNKLGKRVPSKKVSQDPGLALCYEVLLTEISGLDRQRATAAVSLFVAFLSTEKGLLFYRSRGLVETNTRVCIALANQAAVPASRDHLIAVLKLIGFLESRSTQVFAVAQAETLFLTTSSLNAVLDVCSGSFCGHREVLHLLIRLVASCVPRSSSLSPLLFRAFQALMKATFVLRSGDGRKQLLLELGNTVEMLTGARVAWAKEHAHNLLLDFAVLAEGSDLTVQEAASCMAPGICLLLKVISVQRLERAHALCGHKGKEILGLVTQAYQRDYKYEGK